MVGRDGARAFVVYTVLSTKRQGVLTVETESGEPQARFLEGEFPVIHDMGVDEGMVVLLVGTRAPTRFAPSREPEDLLVVAYSGRSDDAIELWRRRVAQDSRDDFPDVSLVVDSGKVYLARGTLISVLDGLSGRELGELAVPGLDERIAWRVSQGAGLLAEETRASVFELPA